MIRLPDLHKPIRKVGLTGSIGTGKSTAASFFARLGVPVIDADRLAREVVKPGRPAHREIIEAFGPEVAGPGGELDRAALASAVFGDGVKLRRLEAIIHPRVREEAEAGMENLLPLSPHGFVVYDVPLLFETGMEKMFDLVVTVYAERSDQVQRVGARSGLTEAEILSRLANQMDVAEKAGRSHVVLDNRGAPEDLFRGVEELVRLIAQNNEEKGLTNRHKG